MTSLSLIRDTGCEGRNRSPEQNPIEAVVLNKVDGEGEQEQDAYDVEQQCGTGCCHF
jgi:hypothetical protein